MLALRDYGLNESFFKEIDSSSGKRNCRTLWNDIQSYLFMYQGSLTT